MVLDEFEIIDRDINRINEIDNLSSVPPMTHTLDNFDCSLREDVGENNVSIEDLLSNCDKVSDREVELPKVVG